MAQWVKRQTLDFGSRHDLAVCEFKLRTEPGIGFLADSAEPAWDILSLHLSAPPPLSLLSVSLS